MKRAALRLIAALLLVAASPDAGFARQGVSSPGPRLDPMEATRAYLAKVPAEQKARSDAYFEGGYWLHLWTFLSEVGAAWLLLALGWSARMRDAAERASRRRPVQTFLYWAQYVVVTSVLVFPLTLYQGFFREHRYGLATQTFFPWFGDRLKELGLAIVLGGITVVILFGVLRRAPRAWWIWGSLAATLLLAVSILISPVFVFPLFNRFTRLQDEKIRGPILSLARANGIPARDVFVMDASRQTTRVSANVSGLFGTERITLNDNLLKRCSLPEIEAVLGHEIGHYVLHHLYKGVVFLGILIVVGFAFLRWSFDVLWRRHGSRWRVRGVPDPAGMPLFAILIACYLFALTPVTNSIIRMQEAEADLFGLNANQEPDGFAEVELKLGEYRKLEPGRLEEILFYDHPSGRSRIYAAMRWKAEHMAPQPEKGDIR
jgi:Zn-dependent protease with chaperone function